MNGYCWTRSATADSNKQIATLLYELAVIFGVIILPRATLYGVWEGKSERNWKREELDIDTRSEKLAAILERDHPIVEAHSRQ